jgi:hypothetical protein
MPISRTRVGLRMRYGWEIGTVPFSKVNFHQPDGYRSDPAGYACMCWDIPLHVPHSWGGLSTVSLLEDGWVTEIEHGELKLGDAIGLLGRESVDADGGVVVMFERWLNDDRTLGYAICWQQLKDTSPGPARRARPIDFRWHAYRFKDIVDDVEAGIEAG